MPPSETGREALIARYVVGELDAAGAERLLALCREKPPVLEELIQHKVTERLVMAAQVEVGEEDCFSREVVGRLRAEGAPGVSLAPQVLQRIANHLGGGGAGGSPDTGAGTSPRRWWATPARRAAAAAALLLAGWCLNALLTQGDAGPGEITGRPKTSTGASGAMAEAVPLAWIEDDAGCRWEGGRAGDLRPGEVLELIEGVARIRFRSFAGVALRGPARFEVGPESSGILHFGRLSADVPERATGFTVLTPGLEVIDLGTHFGVLVDRAGGAEVHVFEGEVEAWSRPRHRGAGPSEKLTLTTAQAARFDTRGLLVDWTMPDYERFPGARRLDTGVRSTNRQVRWIPDAPTSLAEGEFESNNHVFLLPERRGVLLQAPVTVTFLRHRKRGTNSGYRSHEVDLPAGTRVDSYLLHFDPSAPPHDVNGEIVFDRPIIGIIARGDQLEATDGLFGAPGTLYEVAGAGAGDGSARHRGLENDPALELLDVINFAGAQERINVRVSVGSQTVDQIRILVQAKE